VLRYVVLLLMKQGHMSGSELMDAIEDYTGWRPSPGSMYPLLAELDRQGLITQAPSDDPYLKQFAITPAGRRSVDEFRDVGHFRARVHSIRRMYWKLYEEMDDALFAAFSALLDTVEQAHAALKATANASEALRVILDDATRDVRELERTLEVEPCPR
jgi:DNA-binding PadR family transcriptional regulator